MVKRHPPSRAIAASAMLAASGLLATSASAQIDTVVAYYNFDNDTVPGFVPDNSGHGHDGTATGAAAYTAGGGAPISPGGGNAFRFNGDPDSVDLNVVGTAIPFSTITMNDTGTVAFWTLTGSANQTHFGFFQGGNTRQYQAHVPWSDNTVYFDVGGGAGGGQRISAPLPAGYDFMQWHHWAFVKDGNTDTGTIYLDGDVFLSAPQGAPIGQIDTAAIGNRLPASDEAVTGLMDEFIVFNRVLSEAEVEILVRDGGAPFIPEPGALGVLGAAGLGLLGRRARRNGR